MRVQFALHNMITALRFVVLRSSSPLFLGRFSMVWNYADSPISRRIFIVGTVRLVGCLAFKSNLSTLEHYSSITRCRHRCANYYTFTEN